MVLTPKLGGGMHTRMQSRKHGKKVKKVKKVHPPASNAKVLHEVCTTAQRNEAMSPFGETELDQTRLIGCPSQRYFLSWRPLRRCAGLQDNASEELAIMRVGHHVRARYPNLVVSTPLKPGQAGDRWVSIFVS